MKIMIKESGKTVTVNKNYGLRMLEQGLACRATEAKAQAKKEDKPK